MGNSHEPLARLTPREREVLELMARGLTNGQIAEELGISFATAKTHVSAVIGRLDVQTREEAVALYLRERSLRTRMQRLMRGIVPAALLPRLAVSVGVVGLAGAAVTFAALQLRTADTGPQPLVVPLDSLEVDEPKEFMVSGLGEDHFGQPLSVFLVRRSDDSVDAFLGRDPFDGCPVSWNANYSVTTETFHVRQFGPDGRPLDYDTIPPFEGAFSAPCSGAKWQRDGSRYFGPTYRELDEYPVERDGADVVVTFETILLGKCGDGITGGCSPVDGPPVALTALPSPQFSRDAASASP